MSNPSFKYCRLCRERMFRLAALILTTLTALIFSRTTLAVSQTRIISITGDLNFGNVLIGSSAQRTMRISNRGNSPLTVLGIEGPVQPVLQLGGYSTDWNWSGTIMPGHSKELTVTFAPGGIAAAGIDPVEYPGSLTVVSDATSGTNFIPVSGNGIVPAVTRIISVPADLNFGKTPINSIAILNLVIANKGNSELTISNINFPDGFFASMGMYAFTNGTIPAGGQTNVLVAFIPTNVTHYGGTVTVDSDATSGRCEVALSCDGVIPVGHYVGLFSPGMGWASLPAFPFGSAPASSPVDFGDSGYFSGDVAANGSFSGVLLQGNRRQPFSGRFSRSGTFSNMITQVVPAGGDILGVSFHLVDRTWQGAISNQQWSAGLLAYPAIVGAGRPHFINELPPGKYQFDIAGSTNSLLAPTNEGTGTIQLMDSGIAHVSGTLGDGTPFSQDTVRVGNQLPLYVSLYHGRGAVMGWMRCEILQTNLLQEAGTNYMGPEPIIPPITNLFPLTNYPLPTNAVPWTNYIPPIITTNTAFTNGLPATNIPPVIIITNFPPFTNPVPPITNVVPILPQSDPSAAPDEMSRGRSLSPTNFPGTNWISGSIYWFKPAQIDTNYPDGFSLQTTISGPTE